MANLMGGRGGGRKREHEWSEFNDIEGDEGKTLVECSHCGEKVSKRIQRIKNHLEKCRVKNKQDKAVEDINENNIPIPPPPKRSRVMDSFVTKTYLNDKIKSLSDTSRPSILLAFTATLCTDKRYNFEMEPRLEKKHWLKF